MGDKEWLYQQLDDLELLPEEIDFLKAGREFWDSKAKKKYVVIRCKACGHLESLHNGHCCEFCMIPGCPCEWGKVEGYNTPDGYKGESI